MAKKIKLRMQALTAATSLVDFWPPRSGPEQCHELKGERAGIFSMDLNQPYRLLFKALDAATEAVQEEVDNPLPNLSNPEVKNEKAHWAAIKSIEIISVEDTHG